MRFKNFPVPKKGRIDLAFFHHEGLCIFFPWNNNPTPSSSAMQIPMALYVKQSCDLTEKGIYKRGKQKSDAWQRMGEKKGA